MAQIILYDIPTKGPHRTSWSLNPWKTRMILNYKEISYQTIWLEYPEIGPTLRSYQVPPNSASEAPTSYTLPALRIPVNSTENQNQYLQNSFQLAQRLEELYPTPSLHLDSLLLERVMEVLDRVQEVTRPAWVPLIPQNLLSAESAEYFERTRAERLGMSLEEFGKRADEAWSEALEQVRILGSLVEEHGGPFVLGDSVSYADFVVVSFLHCCKRIEPAVFERLVQTAPSLKRLYEACGAWLERDDH